MTMSHTVTVTQRTTTSSSSSSILLLNIGYFKTPSGILKVLELILCCIGVGIVANYFGLYRGGYYTSLFIPELFYLLIMTTCLITTACLLFSCLLSLNTAFILPKTLFEILYHLVAFLLLLCCSVTLLTYLNKNDRYSRAINYNAEVTAAVLGLICSVLYFISTALAVRSFRNG